MARVDTIDRSVKDFLLNLVRYAFKKCDERGVGGEFDWLFAQMGGLRPEFTAAFEDTDEWNNYQNLLAEVAKQQHSVERPHPNEAEATLKKTHLRRGSSNEPKLGLLKGEGTLNRQQAAEALGISTKTIDRWVASGELVPLRIGNRKLRFEKQSLRAKISD